MARKPTSDFDSLQRLCDSVAYSGRSLEFARSTRRNIVKEFIGAHCFEMGSPAPNPINFVALFLSIMIRTLVARHPRAMLSTFNRQIAPDVLTMEMDINRVLDEMGMAQTLQAAAKDALISVGVVKVALATPADSAMAGWNLQAGTWFAKPIDLDDWRFDPYATDLNECGWEGHRYRALLDTVRDSKIYNSNRKELTATDRQDYNAEGDERIGLMGRGRWGGEGESEDHVTLWEIYRPREKCIYTFRDDNGRPALCSDGKPLREQDWIGPDRGPFHHLGFESIPGNAMYVGPVQRIVDMHMGANNILRKQIRQAQDQKTVLPVRGGKQSEMDTLNATPDGCAFSWEGGEPPVPIRYNGPDSQNFTLLLQLKELIDFIGGNLSLLGGRGAQSKTLGQDKMLNENAGVGVSDMQDTMVAFTTGIYKAACWYEWHNPFKTMKADYKLPGLPGQSVPMQSTPRQRFQGKFSDLDIEVNACSMSGKTPQMKSQMLSAIVAELTPLMPLLQQQGIAFDVNAFLTKKAKYDDDSDLAEIFTLREPPVDDSGGSGGPEQPRMNPNTNREYTRNNVSSRTPQDQQRVLAEAMAGTSSGGNPAESNGKPQ